MSASRGYGLAFVFTFFCPFTSKLCIESTERHGLTVSCESVKKIIIIIMNRLVAFRSRLLASDWLREIFREKI